MGLKIEKIRFKLYKLTSNVKFFLNHSLLILQGIRGAEKLNIKSSGKTKGWGKNQRQMQKHRITNFNRTTTMAMAMATVAATRRRCPLSLIYVYPADAAAGAGRTAAPPRCSRRALP